MPTKLAYGPHGAALLDYFRGDTSATLICHQDGERDDVPAAFWFRDKIDPLEALALDLCRGRVLDVGAGTGLHTLELQRRSLHVTAIDVAPECVTIMQERGVQRAEAADLHEFEGGSFDTILCICNGLDKVGRLSDLPRFLDRMQHLLAPGGQLIADSFDLRVGANATRLAKISQRQASGRYFGEMDLLFEYEDCSGVPFTVLQIDYDTLANVADRHSWTCERIGSAGGHYLARMRPR